MTRAREIRLTWLKARIDAVHEVVIHALRTHNAEAIDRAMEEQHQLMQEYRALLRPDGKPTT